MRRNKLKYGIILAILVLSLFPSLIFVKAQENYTIVGDTVFIDDAQAYIAITPHTTNGGYVYANITSKQFTGEVDIALGFNSERFYPSSASWWNPHIENETKQYIIPDIYFTDPHYYVNYTFASEDSTWLYDGIVYLWRNHTVFDKNGTLDPEDDVFLGYEWGKDREHSFVQANKNIRTIYWIEQKSITWDSLSDKISWKLVDYVYNGMNKWYLTRFNVTAGREYYVRLETHIKPKLGDSSGKYTLAIKPSSKTIAEAINDGQFYELDPWLSGEWGQRFGFTLESDIVDTMITMPIRIRISATSGIGDDDVSAIFDEVGVNYKKIAVTTSDGETELVVEVTRWDSTSEEAEFWIRSEVNSGTDTQFYIYYDNNHGDNTNIKDPGDATTIWPTGSGEDWIAVYHFSEASGDLVDSTSNSYDAYEYNTPESYHVEGYEGGWAISFEETDPDAFEIKTDLALETHDPLSILSIARTEGVSGDSVIVGCAPSTDQFYIYTIDETTFDAWRMMSYADSDNWDTNYGQANWWFKNESWSVLGFMFKSSSGSGFQGYINETLQHDETTDVADGYIRDSFPSDQNISIGALAHGGDYLIDDTGFDGDIAFIAFASTNLNGTFFEVFYSGSRDSLINWGISESASESDYDYVDNDTTDIDSSADSGTLSGFSDVQSAPDSSYASLVEENVASGVSTSTIFTDDFESGLGSWTYTDWVIATDQKHGGASSAKLASYGNDQLTLTNALDLSDAVDAEISVWLRKDDTEPSEFYLSYYTVSSGWVNVVDLDSLGGDDVWLFYNAPISNTYWSDDFKVRIDSNPDKNENVWIDDIEINKTTAPPTNYQLDQEMSWTQNRDNTDYAELCINTGTVDAENLEVEIWNKTDSSWAQVFSDLTASQWNNITVKDYLTDSDDVYIRFLDGTRTSDTVQSTWYLDSVLLHTWNSTGTQYNIDASQGVTLAGSSYRIWDITRDFSQGLTLSTDSSRDWTLIRSFTQSLSFSSGSLEDLMEYVLIQVTQSLALAQDSLKTWSLSRSFTQGLSFSSAAESFALFLRNGVQGITASMGTLRSWELTRAFSQSLSFSSNAAADIFKAFQITLLLGLQLSSGALRGWTLSRSFTQGLSFTSLMNRGWSLTRVATQSIISSLGANRIVSAIRELTQGISFSSGAERMGLFLRNAIQGITASVGVLRSWDLTRVASQTIVFAASSFVMQLQLIIREVSIGLTLASESMRTWILSRSFDQGLSFSSYVNRSWTLVRVAIQSITASLEASRVFSAIRQLSQSFVFSSGVRRFAIFARDVSQSFTMAIVSSRSWDLSRTLTQGMSFMSSIFTKWTEYIPHPPDGEDFFRAVSLAFDLASGNIRKWNISRVFTQEITFMSGIQIFLSNWYKQFATLSLSITSNAFANQFIGQLFTIFVSMNLNLSPIIAVSLNVINEFDFLLVFAMVCTLGYFAINDERKIYFGGFAFILWFFSAGMELASSSVNYEVAFLYGAFAFVIIIFILMDRAKNFGGFEDFWKS